MPQMMHIAVGRGEGLDTRFSHWGILMGKSECQLSAQTESAAIAVRLVLEKLHTTPRLNQRLQV